MIFFLDDVWSVTRDRISGQARKLGVCGESGKESYELGISEFSDNWYFEIMMELFT